MMRKSTFRIRVRKEGLGVVWLADTTERTAPLCAWTRSESEAVTLSKGEAEQEAEVLGGLGLKVEVIKSRRLY